MKFKDFDKFITEQYAPVNEAKEKFKIAEAKPSHPNSAGAFTVKFVGPSFDTQTMMAFLQSDPISAPALQKVKTAPDQYFFIYKTMKGGDPRFLAPNSKIWVTYLELIDAKGPDGKAMYVGFNKPPYNNFVKWTDADRLVNQQDPETVQAGKQIVSAVANTGTQQATQGVSDVEKSIAANTKQFMQTGQVPNANATGTPASAAAPTNPVTQTTDPAIGKIVDGFKGIAMGSRGPKVDQLQNTIQKLADHTHNINAAKENRLNVRPGGEFDDIYGVHTAKALQTVLGLDSEPEVIDATVVDKMKQALAGIQGIKAADLTTKATFPIIKGKVQAGKPAPTAVVPPKTGPTPAATPTPVATTGTQVQSTAAPTHVIKDTLIGNIRY